MVSIIIPTLNAENYTYTLLSSLRKQLVPSEIIIIDSSSSDNTVKIAESYGVKTIIIKRENFDHGGTRNLAAKTSSGEIIVFLTQDAIPADAYFIENLIKPLKKSEIALSYGRQVPKEDANPLEKFARGFNYGGIPLIKEKDQICRLGIKTFFNTNVCCAVKKSAFEEVQGFPEKIIMNEDTVLAAKLILKGYKIAYIPEAKVIHSHNYTCGQQFKRYFDIGVSLNRQKWILELIKTEREGYEYIKEEIRFLWRERKWHWIPYAFGEAAAKYAGYRLALMEDKLPVVLKKSLSMHGYFWDKK